MRTSRTYSRHWDLETRQHELLGMDLGEGIVRKALVHGLIVFVLWWSLLLVVLGMPTLTLMTFYLLPPTLLTWYGTKRSTVYWRRRNFLLWGVAANYLITGVRPLIARGRIPAPRIGWRLRTQRLGERSAQLSELPGLRGAFGSGPNRPDLAETYGKAAHIRPRVRMYGPDAVAKARAKTRKKPRKES
ncbi:hypothetical protein WKI65_43840 [Streptomyces sp. MS1.AVA.3]|uniref:hypothetical protein n=1 Tax=Streptomyces decoyicus TaxID=249567 RepID=UPI0030BC09E0